ncbi:thioredoxin, partial [Teladorsagia circumcincta]
EEFDQLLNDSADSLIVIDFYATWCGPCKIMGPKFTKMSSEYPTVVFVKIDVDETDIVEGSLEDDLRRKIEQHKTTTKQNREVKIEKKRKAVLKAFLDTIGTRVSQENKLMLLHCLGEDGDGLMEVLYRNEQ